MYLNKILATTDLSDESSFAFSYAEQEAQRSNSEITLLHIAEPPLIWAGYPGMPFGTEYLTVAQSEIREASKKAIVELAVKHFAGNAVKTVVLDHAGTPASTIAEYAANNHFGLIICAAHGRGFVNRMLVGSTTEALLRTSPCPVLVIPKTDRGRSRLWPYRRILMATDLADSSEPAFRYAAFEAKRNSAEVVLGYVLEDLLAPELVSNAQHVIGPVKDVQDQYIKEVSERLARYAHEHFPLVEVATKLIEKTHSVANSLTEFARSWECDLMVLAAQKVPGAAHFSGTIERTLRQASCPVLVVPVKEQ